VLAVIPTTRPAADDRLAFRLIAEGGLLPSTVTHLLVTDVRICGNQAHIQVRNDGVPRTVIITDRALVHDLASHIQSHCIGRYLFVEPFAKPVRRRKKYPGYLPPAEPDQRPMNQAKLIQRWRTYSIRADVSLSLADVVAAYVAARCRQHCEKEDREVEALALRQQLAVLRAGRAA
jgi:hypothetical protein